MNFVKYFAKYLVVFVIFFIAGCAFYSRPDTEDLSSSRLRNNYLKVRTEFQGRIALKIGAEAGAEQPQAQLFSGGFELIGNAPTGALTLYTPLGGTAAALTWRPGEARMEANGQVRQFNSLAEMLKNATGAELPVTSLFAWLRGENTAEPGWSADLSQFANGRIFAQRAFPQPQLELRVILDAEP